MFPVYDVVYHNPPGPIFHGWYIRSWTSVGAKQVGVGNISPGAFRGRIARWWRPLGCRAIDLGKKTPQRGVVYTVVPLSYTVPRVARLTSGTGVERATPCSSGVLQTQALEPPSQIKQKTQRHSPVSVRFGSQNRHYVLQAALRTFLADFIRW